MSLEYPVGALFFVGMSTFFNWNKKYTSRSQKTPKNPKNQKIMLKKSNF